MNCPICSEELNLLNHSYYTCNCFASVIKNDMSLIIISDSLLIESKYNSTKIKMICQDGEERIFDSKLNLESKNYLEELLMILRKYYLGYELLE